MFLQLCEKNNAIVIDAWKWLKKAKTQYLTLVIIAFIIKKALEKCTENV